MNVGYILIAFVAMLGMMLLGLPIAVSMAAVGIVGGLLAYGVPFVNSIAPGGLGRAQRQPADARSRCSC